MKTYKIFKYFVLAFLFTATELTFAQLKVFDNGNVSVGTLNNNFSSRLYVEGYHPKISLYGTNSTNAAFWVSNTSYAYGFGIEPYYSNYYGYIYKNINTPEKIMSFNKYGCVGIGLSGSSPYSGSSYRLYVYGNSRVSSDLYVGDDLFVGDVLDVDGNAYCLYGYWSGSDVRLKSEIVPIENALQTIEKIDGKKYKMQEKESMKSDGKCRYGLIAQEVIEVLPELVIESEDSMNYLAINYDGFIPILIEAIKEQQHQITELQNKIQTLESLTALDENEVESDQLSNYPNPFDQETQISLVIPKSTKQASILIYDSRGTLVKEIEILDRGNANVTFQAANLDAGVYSYTLVADNKVINTNKMVIQK